MESYTFVGRFIVYPDEAAQVGHTLWIAHCHLMECWASTPRLAALSPEPASGKTRALEVTELLVPRPMLAVEFSPAYLFRKISDEAGLPTILHDEVDAVFNGRAPQNEELRALYNSGHRRGAFVGRVSMQGKKAVLEEYPGRFAAVALAGLGNLPETLMSRSLVIRMRRRAPGEFRWKPFRRRLVKKEADPLLAQLAEWAESVAPSLADYAPEMPPGVEDRGADCWEPLIAVADAAGGAWPGRARAAAVTFVAFRVLPRKRNNRSVSSCSAICARCSATRRCEDGTPRRPRRAQSGWRKAPWGNYRGKPVDARARLGGAAEKLRRQVRLGPRRLQENQPRATPWPPSTAHAWDAGISLTPPLETASHHDKRHGGWSVIAEKRLCPQRGMERRKPGGAASRVSPESRTIRPTHDPTQLGPDPSHPGSAAAEGERRLGAGLCRM